jgi:hypothetical protein
MWANRIVDASLMILSWVVVPLQVVTTFVLGILVTISFGLLLLPFTLIWVVLFLGPLLALSWLWRKMPLLRIPVRCCGIPFAVVGDTYCCLIPSMGEWESRYTKLALCETFPFTLDCWALICGKRSISFQDPDNLDKVILGFYRKNPTIYKYLTDLPLRPGGYLYTAPPG